MAKLEVHPQAELEESLSIRRTLGGGQGMAEALNNFGAAAYLKEAYNEVRSFLAKVVKRQGDQAYAASLLEEGLTLGRKVGAARILVDLVEKVAGLAAARGEAEEAARLWERQRPTVRRSARPWRPFPAPATSAT